METGVDNHREILTQTGPTIGQRDRETDGRGGAPENEDDGGGSAGRPHEVRPAAS